MPIRTIIKTPEEVIPITLDFTNALPTDSIISSGIGSVTDSDGNDVTATLLVSTTMDLDSGATIGTLEVQNGTDGTNYSVKFTVTLDTGPNYVLAYCVPLKVIDC